MNEYPDNKKPVIVQETCDSLCTCGKGHAAPEINVYSAEDAYSVLAEDCGKATGAGSALLVCDENTHRAAGSSVQAFLEKKSVAYKVLKLPGDSNVTDTLAEYIRDKSAGHSLIIAVGAGTINDLGKYVSGKTGVPYWSVPTAPSMNGYTSSIVAIKVKGVKQTLPAPPPQWIYVHPEVIRNAPVKLRQAGFCDVLAKSVSDCDWQAESLLFSGLYCSLPSTIVAESEQRYIDKPEKIRQGDAEAVLGLFNGLLVSGIGMSLAGSSAPASGGEHLISHFLDMREGITGRKPDLHGLQVGAGIVLSAACYRRLASLEAGDLKNRAEKKFEQDVRNIASVWGNLASEVERQFLNKRENLLKFDAVLPTNWQPLKTLFSSVRKPEFFIDLIRRTGFEMTLESLKLSKDEFFLAAVSARTIRGRITVLDIAAHAGVLREAAKETIELLT